MLVAAMYCILYPATFLNNSQNYSFVHPCLITEHMMLMLIKSGQAVKKRSFFQLVILSIIKEVKKVGQVVLKTSI